MLFPECEGWSCWESQLRDTTRITILKLYNKFRNQISKGQCCACKKNKTVPNIIQLVSLTFYYTEVKKNCNSYYTCFHRLCNPKILTTV